MSGTFMAAEIAETGLAIRRQLDGAAERIGKLADELRAGEPAFVATIARGSSDHAALFLKHVVELKLGLACASLGPSIASLYHAPMRLSDAVAITISQSGRSPDIIAMQRAAKLAGATAIALVNETDSPVAAEADALLPLLAGTERSVAATKSMIAALVAGVSLAARWSRDDGLAAALEGLPAILDPVAPPPGDLETALAGANSLYVIGRGATYAVAMEAALKLKETSAIHAEAFSSAEVLHGPAGVVGPGFPALGFAPAPGDAARDGFFATIDRLASFGAAPLIVDVLRHARFPTLVAPDAGHPMVTPIAALHAFYWLAEAVARRRGRNPDDPPHLMKVTRTV
ncbi:glutamine--fructose-6-phosphate transaminase [Roseiarcus fermentans]|uniref:Glutamine--fructose-6-phosphate transaminase n=1 Tax=Roseiarcus fermentans TaxID=1473586 RepID=A0A366F8Y7_9HYPH|nr:SIS domain-containing protein [Roseiarcus fermentans]RBP11123.1 glutamine--fructose-6-phosphate transaminase [Roseiarcus fermentans]